MKELHEMLVKWEANNTEVRALCGEKMKSTGVCRSDETYKALRRFRQGYITKAIIPPLEGKKKVEEGFIGNIYSQQITLCGRILTNEGQKATLRSDKHFGLYDAKIEHEMRFKDYPIDKMIYVVGKRPESGHFRTFHSSGFKVGKDLVHPLRYRWSPNGKMKSREGTVVDADDLVARYVDTKRRALSEDKMNKPDDITEEEKTK